MSGTNSLSEHDLSFPPAPLPQRKNLVELFAANVSARSQNIFAKGIDVLDDQFFLIHWNEAASEVLRLARYLRDSGGVKRGDRVAILSSSRYEWVIADLAILALGAVSVSVYHSLTAEDAGFILWETGARCVFIENEEQAAKLRSISHNSCTVPETEEFQGGKVTLSFDCLISFEEADGANLYRSIVDGDPSAGDTEELLQLASSIERTDLASIVYTSGTTAAAKGVLQTHGNHLEMVESVTASGLLATGEGVFLFLPLAHSFARLCVYGAIAPGGSIYFPTVVDKRSSKFDAKRTLRDLAASNPRIFPSVPRLFEKIMARLTAEAPAGLKNKLVCWSVRTYRKFRTAPPVTVKEKLARTLAQAIMGKIRMQIFGGELLYCVSGGAPLNSAVIEFFDEIDVTILEGYGLTETTPAMTANTKEFRRIGSVGRRFNCNEIRIEPSDGEIIVRGGNIAQGYYKRPRATAEAWREGWFHTGDIGHLDSDGFLFITDRKKDLIVTAGGKKVPPALVEGKLKTSPLVSSVFVFGDRKPYLVALVTLNEENVISALQAKGGEPGPVLCEDSTVRLMIEDEVNALNANSASFEQIRRFTIVSGDFTIENGLLSPTLKMKRPAVLERYRGKIEAMYR